MKFRTVFRLIAAFIFLMPMLVKAQILEPVTWDFTTEKLADDRYNLVFTADIEPKWHLYSQNIPMSPPATTFSFDDNATVEFIGKVTETESVEQYDPNFDMVLRFFSGQAVFKQEVKLLSSENSTVKGVLEFMSCDDMRCLPPSEIDFSFNLKGSASGVPVSANVGAVAESKVLEPVNWSYDVNKLEDSKIELIFKAKIDKGFHLYSIDIPENGPLPTVFTFYENDKLELVGSPLESLEGTVKYDEIFEMDIKSFEDKAEFRQTIKLKDKAPVNIAGEIAYMVCNDVGCVALYHDFDVLYDGATVKAASAQVVAEKPVEKQKRADILGSGASLWGFFFLAFLGGLAAIVTPCVFPMIPMTVSFFMKDKEEDKLKGRLQAIVYGLAIIGIYTLIGSILAVVAGPDIANWLSTHWLPNILFFVIFVVFAASFFGMFDITLPHWLVSKSDSAADRGGFVGSIFMALTLVLVSFSCTGPIVGTILVESAGGQVLKPIIGMFGFSLAFALPFTLLAFFPSWLNNLPKSGGWLNSVKVVLGFLELALGLKFLSIADQTYHWGLLDRETYLAFWIVIFFLMGLYLMGKIKFAHDSDVKFLSVPRLIFSIITFSFVVYLIPGMFGAPLKALSGYVPPMHTHDFDLTDIIRKNSGGSGATAAARFTDNDLCETPKFGEKLNLPHGLQGYFDYEQGLACAKALDKPIFLDFTGHGCVNCREMEANVWSDPQVLQLLRDEYLIIALYVDDKTALPEEEWVLSDYDNKWKKTIGRKFADFQVSKFGVNAQPFYVLMGHENNVVIEPRAYSLDVNEFIAFLKEGVENYKKGKTVFTIPE
ncbi:MAG: protein-disulfide reductase DsbD family protein [Bacteroidales bacterium]|jgi:thiol:disulfide interchange protein DsbD|nr:protein-disulfide reductase DsbD family protein [Bacteroidales bacterium]